MDWYAPLTILPAIGLIILSTANFLISLNNEIYQLEGAGKKNDWIIKEKIGQLKRLGIANALLYTSALFFMVSSLTKALIQDEFLFKVLMIIAAAIVTLALIILFIHSIKAISIRQKTLQP